MKLNAYLARTRLLAFGLVVGCGAAKNQENLPSDFGGTEADTPAGFGSLGIYQGRLGENGKLEISALSDEQLEALGGEFLTYKSRYGRGHFTLDTPSDGTATGSCNANQYCAQITVQNNSGVDIDSFFAEIVNYNSVIPAGAQVAWAGPAFPNSAAYTNIMRNPSAVRAAAYGTIGAGVTKSVEWKWSLNLGSPNATYFGFVFDIFGEYKHTNAYSGTNQYSTAAVDACVISGATTVMVGADNTEANIQLPFPFTIYDGHYDRVVIGSNGYTLFYVTGGAVPSIPTGDTNTTVNSSTPPFAGWYPFWDDLLLEGGACYVTTGTKGSRTFTITWKNARVNVAQPGPGKTWSNERFNISVTMEEATDRGAYIYSLPSTGTPTDYTRGKYATIADRGTRLGAPYAKLSYLGQPTPASWFPSDPSKYSWRLWRFALPADP